MAGIHACVSVHGRVWRWCARRGSSGMEDFTEKGIYELSFEG